MHKINRDINIRRINSQHTEPFGSQDEDLLSRLLARMAEHPLLVFVAILLCMMALLITCDRALGSVDKDDPAVSRAMREDDASIINAGALYRADEDQRKRLLAARASVSMRKVTGSSVINGVT